MKIFILLSFILTKRWSIFNVSLYGSLNISTGIYWYNLLLKRTTPTSQLYKQVSIIILEVVDYAHIFLDFVGFNCYCQKFES